ncbi:MAG: DNA repair protein RecO [Oscillospiraceae bacterium]|nr:DNA repair protein RecO [Oscillospiraceae bacterium]
MFLTTRALVLREVKYKEADKILTVLTPSDGKLTVKARGAMRKSCRYAAASQIFALSEMTLFGSRGRWSLNEAETVEQFLPLRDSLESFALAAYFAEMLELLSDEDCPGPEMLQLGLNSLYALSRGLFLDEQIKAAFELRLMCLAGFEPALDGCRVCGKEPEDALLSLNGGVLHCRSCRPEVSGVSLPVPPECLQAMRYIISAPPKRLFSFSLPEGSLRRLADICEAYALAQLERSCGALDYYKTVKRNG